MDSDDWQRRARREAEAIIHEAMPSVPDDLIVSVVACAWLQGVNFGAHDTLRMVEEGFEQMRAGL